MSRKPLTKPGQYGTLYRYKISYKDTGDSGCPIFSYSLWAYNQEHAETKFYDSEDADGWEIISISVVHESMGSCGWCGPIREFASAAEDDAANHEVGESL